MLLFGLIFRLVFSILPGFKIDVDAWFAWAERLNQVGLPNFYSDQIWTNYAPGYLYLLYFLGWVKGLLNISDAQFYLILKLPSIFAEVILGLFIYKLIKRKSFFWANIAATSVLLNPVFIFNSAIWGQIDGFFSLILFLTIYFLIEKKIILSSIFFGLAFLIKPQAIALLPAIILYLIKNFSIENIIRMLLPTVLTILIMSLPFFINQPFTGIIQLFSNMLSDYSYISLFAYNSWGAVGFWVPDNQSWNNLSYQNWGYILFGIYWAIITYFYFKKKLSLFSLAALATLSFYFLPTRIHERYLYPAIIFLIVYSFSIKSKLLITLTVILSVIHFLNLYYVYVYYNEFYLKLPKTLYFPFLYNFLDTNGKLLSIVSTTLFVLISIVIIKSQYANKKS